MIKNIFAIFIFSLLFVACSTNELSKQEKEVQRQEVSKELLSDISYILFLLKQKDLKEGQIFYKKLILFSLLFLFQNILQLKNQYQ